MPPKKGIFTKYPIAVAKIEKNAMYKISPISFKILTYLCPIVK